jgi:hypothetical protein
MIKLNQKMLHVAKLRTLLNEYPNDFMVTVSVAGNLLILDSALQPHSFVDLNLESIEVFSEELIGH